MYKNRKLPSAWHTESLLNVPLIRQAFGDANFSIVRRGIDPQWSYNKLIPLTVSGFNPLAQSYYCPMGSSFDDWMSNPSLSARDFNENDLLVREALFMAHDYLHAWAYEQMAALQSQVDLFSGEITEDTLEDYVFCHLLSEAVATIGLDYWCLSKRQVNSYCPIGSTVNGLTVSYNERDLSEYRRFYSDFTVQSPAFFTALATFYATGVFDGFDLTDLRRSPRLLTWLEHELSYGVTQRILSRKWFRYMGGISSSLPNEDHPLTLGAAWQHDLITRLGELLWNRLKDLEDSGKLFEGLKTRPVKRAHPDGVIDFRFTNLNALETDQYRHPIPWTRDTYKPYLCQRIAQIRFTPESVQLAKFFPLLFEQCNSDLEQAILGGAERVPQDSNSEPRDLFVAN